MSNQDAKLGHIPDVFKFAYEQRRLSGEVKVAAFERLSDLLTDQSGVISYKLEGDV
ncbi:MAG: metal-binding protein, partial [Betaproteobacteria bacterium HGW-Betaproteobacteria-21]